MFWEEWGNCHDDIYQDTDFISGKSFYSFKIRVHANDAYQGVYLSIRVSLGTCDLWEPTEGTKGEGWVSFSVGHISFSIWIPTETVDVLSEPFMEKMSWYIFVNANDADFACNFWLCEGVPFFFRIYTWTINFDEGVFHEQDEAKYFTDPDIDDNGVVGLGDVVALANAYGSTPTRLADPNWNANADLAPPYWVVGLSDLATLANHYG